MALSEFEIKQAERILGRFVESRRPPTDIRPQVDLAFGVSRQSVEIFEVRPAWRSPGRQH
jgi:hypothetical protein